jgi:hypothetical protein
MEVKGVAKNPLAIIALFISFMYGSASLILGTSIDKLNGFNQDALVGFLIGFPIVIFVAFFYLVIRHHRKLYAPGDYRSDESFLAGIESIPDRQKGSEEGELEETSELAPQPPQGAQKSLPKADKNKTASAAKVSAPPANFLQNSELAESLVADFFLKRFGGLLKRDVRFLSKNKKSFVFDFAIEVRDVVYVGEVKYTRGSLIRSSLWNLLGKFTAFEVADISDAVRFVKVGAIIIEDRVDYAIASNKPVEIERRMREVKGETLPPGVIIEVMTMTELINAIGPNPNS